MATHIYSTAARQSISGNEAPERISLADVMYAGPLAHFLQMGGPPSKGNIAIRNFGMGIWWVSAIFILLRGRVAGATQRDMHLTHLLEEVASTKSRMPYNRRPFYLRLSRRNVWAPICNFPEWRQRRGRRPSGIGRRRRELLDL